MNLTVAVCVLAMTATALGADNRGYVLEFSGSGCAPCQQVAPIISKLEREGLPIQSVNVESERALASQYRIDRVPTFVLIVDGREVERAQGALTETAIRRMLAKIPGPQRVAGGPLDVSLGESAPLPRPEVRDTAESRPAKPRMAPPEKTGLKLWPFPRGEQSAAANPVVRGNDSLASTAPKGFPEEHALPQDPMASSSRIRVITGDSLVKGSGTVIESRRGRTTLMTCGHIFRNAGSTTKIEVDLFETGVPKTFVGTVVGYNLEADIGLVTIPTAETYPACPIAPPMGLLSKGTSVAGIGCSGGDPPSREQLKITKLNEFEGPETISCTGVPVQGRSGGGLFNEQDQLIGVCFAADKQGKGGVYCGRGPMIALLEKHNYSHLVPSATPAESAIVNQDDPSSGAAPWSEELSLATVPPSPPAARQTPVSKEAAPSVDEFTAGDAEVVIFIKTRTANGPQNKVILIQKPSRSFQKFLEGELTDEEEVSQSPRSSQNGLQTTGLETPVRK